VIVTTSGKKPYWGLSNGIYLIRIPKSVAASMVTFNISLKKDLETLLPRLDADILHAHHAFSPLGLVTSEIANQFGIPSILTNHSIPIGFGSLKGVWGTISKGLSIIPMLKTINLYDEVIAVSSMAAEYISYFYKGRIHIIPNAIDLEEFRITASKDEFGLKENDPMLLMVTRSSPKKGIEVALLAFKVVVKKLNNAKLFIAGPTGAYLQYLKFLTKVFDIEKHVKLLGFVPRRTLVKLYKAADLLIHPVLGGESFGIVLLEAMASGTPIVATYGDGLRYVLEGSGAGMCIDVLNPEKIARIIIRLLNSPNLLKEMSSAGLKFATRFSWSRIIDKIIRIYKEVSRSRKEK